LFKKQVPFKLKKELNTFTGTYNHFPQLVLNEKMSHSLVEAVGVWQY